MNYDSSILLLKHILKRNWHMYIGGQVQECLLQLFEILKNWKQPIYLLIGDS